MERNELSALERQARTLEAALSAAFDAGDTGAARLEGHGVRVSQVMAGWSRETDILRSRFQALGNTIGQGFAAALTPAVAAMNRFMTTALRTARTFRSFLYSLFGKKYSEAMEGAADAWDDLGSSASGAGRRVSAAAREVRRSLMAFDQINRLDWEPESSSASTGGGGGSGGGSAAPGLGGWEELIGPNAFGELLRSLWEDSRFYEVGQALAAKLGEMVDGLDSALTGAGFQERIKNGIRALTETVNGFLAGLSFTPEDALSVAGRIGDFLGDAVGLALESAHQLLSGLDWNALGTSIAQLVNGGVASLREKEANLGTVLSDWLNAKLGTLDGIFSTLDWSGAGAYVAENVNDWFRNMDWEKLGRTIRDGILGLKEFITTALGQIDVDWGKVVRDLIRGFTGSGESLTLPMTGRLTAWKDALSNKWIGGFGATMSRWYDSIAAKNKWISNFGATMSRWYDSIAAKNKWVTNFGATMSRWYDKIASKNKWVSGFGATMTRWYDSIASKNKWISGFGATISQWWNAITNKLVSFRAQGGVYAGGHWSPIQAYAGGGAPGGGQLFLAREAGPELVGTLGGHTAVMNNDQIVASVSAGVARAIAGIKFYSRERATPALAFIGSGLSQSERHLDTLARRAEEEASAGGTARLAELLVQILGAVKDIDPDVYLDGQSVKDRVVSLVNQHTRATGVCEILV